MRVAVSADGMRGGEGQVQGAAVVEAAAAGGLLADSSPPPAASQSWVVGCSNRQNDQLTHAIAIAKPVDTWLHARGVPG